MYRRSVRAGNCLEDIPDAVINAEAMKNWKTSIGGAIGTTGTALLGVGILPQLSQLSPTTSHILSPYILDILWYTAFVGFIMTALGKGVTSFFAADASNLKDVAAGVDKINLEGPSSDTQLFVKPPTDSPK